MRIRARGVVRTAILAGSLAAACGGGGDPLPLTSLAQQMLQAHCEQAARCGEFGSADTCVAGLVPSDTVLPAITLLALDPGFDDAVGSGQVTYDGNAARDCVTALAAESCDVSSRDQRTVPDACIAMLTGKLAEGSQCVFDQECASARCSPPASCESDYVCCYGTCQTPPHTVAIGSACSIDSDCAVEAFCSGSGCAPLLGSGESCSASNDCDFGLVCVRPMPTQSGECAPPPTLGQPCPGHQCADLGTTCGSSGNCVALGLSTDPCATDLDCAPELVCDPTALKCSAPPVLGQPCSVTCAVGSWCNNPDGSGGICDAPLANTMMCEAPDECVSGYCADGDFATTCIDRPICY